MTDTEFYQWLAKEFEKQIVGCEHRSLRLGCYLCDQKCNIWDFFGKSQTKLKSVRKKNHGAKLRRERGSK